MIYSNREKALQVLLQTEEDVSSQVVSAYNTYIQKLTEWIKSLNSDIIAKTALAITDYTNKTYVDGTIRYIENFSDNPGSFKAISEKLKTSENSIRRMDEFPLRIAECFKQTCQAIQEVDTTCSGDEIYDIVLVEKYTDISQEFENALMDIYDDSMRQFITLIEDNILADALKIIVEYQLMSIINAANFSSKIYNLFLEWFKEALQKSQDKIDAVNAKTKTDVNTLADARQVLVTMILANFSGGISGASTGESGVSLAGSSGINNTGSEISSTMENNEANAKIREESEKIVNAISSRIGKELQSKEDVKNYIQMSSNCSKILKDGKAELKNSEGQKRNAILEKIGKGVKGFFDKYGSTIIEIACLALPLFFPGEAVVAELGVRFAAFTKWMKNGLASEKDVNTAEFLVEAAKAIIPTKDNPDFLENTQKYISENGLKIGKKVLKLIVDNDEYQEALDITPSKLNDAEVVKQYRKEKGEVIPDYPKSYTPVTRDYIGNSEPRINVEHKMLKRATEKLPDVMQDISLQKVNEELCEMNTVLNSTDPYIKVPSNSESGKLLRRINDFTRQNQLPELMANSNGNYNKQDYIKLVSHINNNRSPEGTYDTSRTVASFITSQYGYPLSNKNRELVVKDVMELIAIYDLEPDAFVVEDKTLAEQITKASIAYYEDGSIFGGLLSLAVGAGLIAFTPWNIPQGVLALCCGISHLTSSTGDENKDAYSQLANQIGRSKLNHISANYNNAGDCRFEKKSQNASEK